MRKATKRILTIGMAGVMLAVVAGASWAQGRIWYVWINTATQPATIGVADSSYRVAGWSTLAGPFPNDRAAWVEACRLHFAPQYNSPDIAAGRVRC